MKNKIRILQLMLLGTMIFSIESCQSDQESLAIEPTNDLVINNAFSEINQRVTVLSDTIDLISDNSTGRYKGNLDLILVSEVAAPVLEGQKLMATSVDVKGNLMAVSYNFKGDVYAGGVDLMLLNGDELTLTSQIITSNADVNAAYFDRSKLYIAGAANGNDSTAFVYRLPIKNNEAKTEGSISKRLGGFASTGIIQTGKYVYVSTGNDSASGGGVFTLDEKSLELSDYKPFHDARWLQSSGDKLYIQQANPGNLIVFNIKNNQEETQFPFVGSQISESKSTFDISGDLIFLASGEIGVQIHNLENGEKVGEIPLPEGASSEMLTNSVSVENDLIFISNGESVMVATFDKGKTEAPNPEILGRLDLGNFQSINHVGYRNKRLIIAAGLGGTKVVKVVKK